MVGVFRRSFSFPTKPVSKPPISHHVRSISLPSRSHPLISHLNHHLANLTLWFSQPDSRTAGSLCACLDRLKTVHNHLDDVINLDQTQQSLRRHPLWVEKLLEQILRFVDVYGSFQTLILYLKQEHSAAQVAMRLKDEEKIEEYVKFRKRMARQLVNLVSTIKRQKMKISEHGDGEIAVTIEEVIGVTATVSMVVFDGIALSILGGRRRWMDWEGLGFLKKSSVSQEKGIDEFRELGFRELKKKGKEEMKMAMRKMQDLEVAICALETQSQRLFRSLISVRVSLLNALSQQSTES